MIPQIVISPTLQAAFDEMRKEGAQITTTVERHGVRSTVRIRIEHFDKSIPNQAESPEGKAQ